jgi:hypothetical protein
LDFFRILLEETSEKCIYRQQSVLTQRELVSKKSKMWKQYTERGQKCSGEKGKGAVGGQQEEQQAQGQPWPCIRPEDLAEGVWTVAGVPEIAQKAPKGRNSCGIPACEGKRAGEPEFKLS